MQKSVIMLGTPYSSRRSLGIAKFEIIAQSKKEIIVPINSNASSLKFIGTFLYLLLVHFCNGYDTIL